MKNVKKMPNTDVSVASIDGAVRKAQSSGGMSMLIRELELIASAAGLSKASTAGSSCTAAQDDNDSPELDAVGEDSVHETQLRLPTQRSSPAASISLVMVEDVTAVRAHAAEERRAAAARAEFFMLRRFLPFAHKLVATIGGEWLPLMSDTQVVTKYQCFCVFLWVILCMSVEFMCVHVCAPVLNLVLI